MKLRNVLLLTCGTILLSLLSRQVQGRSIQYPIRSDVIVTQWPANKQGTLEENVKQEDNENQPGFMRRQLMRFGQVMSRVGNAMGSHATKITSAVDKVCEIVKTIIPLLAAVCHVGQFKFCAASTGAPGDLSDAMSPTSLNLDEPDKR